MATRRIPIEALIELRQRLGQLPARSPQRRMVLQQVAQLYGVSEDTMYRAMRQERPLQSTNRSDRSNRFCRADREQPRVMPRRELERYCELIAALKWRTENRKGRHLSTVQAIRLLEEEGIETPEGYVQAPKGLLKKATVNHYLKQWGYDIASLKRQPPAVRFQAENSNDCWQFDLSPSDLKHLKAPAFIDPQRGEPLLMLYSVVDDRSGVAYQEYHSVYGEDVEAALRFLFAAMSSKPIAEFPFQGMPKMLYMDNGPIAKSRVFQKVMSYLGVEVVTHKPQGSEGHKITARAKGKVERPFRSVKEMHETLYHLHAPETETEANAGLMRFLIHYNRQPHRSEPHTRLEDWLENLPPEGIRQMCSWERFCTFAREPERRKVGIDARISVEAVTYEVDPDLAGETVTLWWGLFDNELYVEHRERRYGPYVPVGGPIPLHHYRQFKKTRSQKRAERIGALAKQLALPDTARSTSPSSNQSNIIELPVQSFVDPDPFEELTFPSKLSAKRAIADYLGYPLAQLTAEQMAYIEQLLESSLNKKQVLTSIREYFIPSSRRPHAE